MKIASIRLATALWFAVTLAACADDESGITHSPDELLGVALTVDDMSFAPSDWEFEENMRKVIEAPTPPWDGTLDPYLCSGAAIPPVLLLDQVQVELTGGSVMQVLVSTDDAEQQFDLLDDAYQSCESDSSLAYEPLTGVPALGDESVSYRSRLGALTIARFGNDLMILKWWVGEYFDDVSSYYDDLVNVAATRLETL